jgi:guanylate kinase
MSPSQVPPPAGSGHRSIFVITGPSGVGKGTLISALRARHPELGLSISATTRSRRVGEQDGGAYYFLTDQEFDRRLAAGEFVEHATYAGHRYGTLRSELERHTRSGEPVVLEIEVEGARQVRDAIPSAVLVFIAPPSLAVLRERLEARDTDDPREIAMRLAAAETELAAREEFAFTVVNDRLGDAVDALDALYRRERESP